MTILKLKNPDNTNAEYKIPYDNHQEFKDFFENCVIMELKGVELSDNTKAAGMYFNPKFNRDDFLPSGSNEFQAVDYFEITKLYETMCRNGQMTAQFIHSKERRIRISSNGVEWVSFWELAPTISLCPKIDELSTCEYRSQSYGCEGCKHPVMLLTRNVLSKIANLR